MTLTATPLYAGLIGLLYIYLSMRVIRHRRAYRVSIGDANDPELATRVRVHGNCAEYAPLALILLGLAELQGAPLWSVHILGLLLITGRILHAYGLSASPQIMRFRVSGMVMTFAMLLIGSMLNIALALI